MQRSSPPSRLLEGGSGVGLGPRAG
jgi:hypothetical protein